MKYLILSVILTVASIESYAQSHNGYLVDNYQKRIMSQSSMQRHLPNFTRYDFGWTVLYQCPQGELYYWNRCGYRDMGVGRVGRVRPYPDNTLAISRGRDCFYMKRCVRDNRIYFKRLNAPPLYQRNGRYAPHNSR